MEKGELITLAKQIASAKALDPALVCAIVETESNWETYAIRHEPAFQIKYVVPLHLLDTETVARSISWGLLQLMGEAARELGYKGYLAGLCDPQVGLEYGCMHYQNKLNIAKKIGGPPQDILIKSLLLWNGGANTQYPSQVLARMSKYRQ